MSGAIGTYHVRIGKMRPRVSLVRSVHGGKLDGIPNEEDRLIAVSKAFRLQYEFLLTVLLKTQSKLPSSVYIFIPQP